MDDKIEDVFIHAAALVETDTIGAGSRIWAFVHILKGAVIGKNANVCDHCFIEQGVKLGDNVTIKSGVHIWEGVFIDDDVFVGPNVVFTNNLRPRSKQYKDALPTIIEKGVSIGAGSIILAGIKLGKFSMSGIGSVITRDVPNHALVYGNPARVQGWVDECGEKLKPMENGTWISKEGEVYIKTKDGLAKQ